MAEDGCVSDRNAIKKGLEALGEDDSWEVPYLPMDPGDVGRAYDEVIRINSQSGKAGIAYVLERDRGLRLPRRLQVEFRQVVQRIADETGEELSPKAVWEAFGQEYLGRREPFELVHYREHGGRDVEDRLVAVIRQDGVERSVEGCGNGPIAAFVDALRTQCGVSVRISDYRQHAVGTGEDATAVAYVEVITEDGKPLFGVGRHENTVEASLEAVLSAVNRSQAHRADRPQTSAG